MYIHLQRWLWALYQYTISL